MLSRTPPDIYDENSVFKNLLSDEKPIRPPTQGERLEKVFADSPSLTEPLNVTDFLPSY